MTINRRQFGKIALAGAVSASTTRFAWAQKSAEFKMKYGTSFPSDHPGAVRIKEAAELIKKESDGRIDLQVYPNSQLGSEPDMVSQTRSGALDFMSTAGSNLQSIVPVAGINGVAFAFKDYDRVWAAMDGELGAYVRAALAKINLYAFDKVLDNGYRNITTSTKAIVTPADLVGVKIRVPGIPMWVAMFKALGASPATINFGELYSSLQTKVVDGQENPLAMIQTAKIYEVQKFCSMTGHTWDGHFVFTNQKKWMALPADVRDIIARNLNAAVIKQRADIYTLNTSLETKLKQSGLAFNHPEKQPFIDTLKKAGFYEQWKTKYGAEAWAKLEKYSEHLT